MLVITKLSQKTLLLSRVEYLGFILKIKRTTIGFRDSLSSEGVLEISKQKIQAIPTRK